MVETSKAKPGPKAGAAYGMGLAAGPNRRQLSITLPTDILEEINAVCERTHQQRAAFFLAAVQRLLDSDDPTFGQKSGGSGKRRETLRNDARVKARARRSARADGRIAKPQRSFDEGMAGDHEHVSVRGYKSSLTPEKSGHAITFCVFAELLRRHASRTGEYHHFAISDDTSLLYFA